MSRTHHAQAFWWPRIRPIVLALGLGSVALSASGQWLVKNTEPWHEDEAPPPPAYSEQHLIEIDMPIAASVKVGIAPDSLTLNRTSGVVRYVVVARGPAATNASYEGIRCATAEHKVYAHQAQGQDWKENTQAEWKPMRGEGGITPSYPWQLAEAGLCDGKTTPLSVRTIQRLLRATGNRPLY